MCFELVVLPAIVFLHIRPSSGRAELFIALASVFCRYLLSLLTKGSAIREVVRVNCELYSPSDPAISAKFKDAASV